jgi:HlyD family secretion protein
VQVPRGALFRAGDQWRAFVLEGGRARLRTVRVGHQGTEAAEILSGIAPGEPVIVYPSRELRDGDRARELPR